MANHKSAQKRHRQSLKKRERNRAARAEIRTVIKNALALSASGDNQKALEQTRIATKLLDKAAIHGLLHKNNALRRISRINAKIAAHS
jgi:small subunit ribosomal protein S20